MSELAAGVDSPQSITPEDEVKRRAGWITVPRQLIANGDALAAAVEAMLSVEAAMEGPPFAVILKAEDAARAWRAVRSQP